ncbi:MAG: epimerase / dehydratase [Myxococcaceae bacterium]|nr:epimerase / dehydratase [Myxococcaceae bacterium]
MIPLFTREQMRAVDRAATERYGVASIVLMENAGAHAFAHLQRHYGRLLQRVLIVGGQGQNGGDGWVVARHLHASGFTPTCLLVGREERVQGDARVNLAALHALGICVISLHDDIEALLEHSRRASMIVDALFGTGLSRPLDGPYARAVNIVSQAGVPVCALDLPSGVDANTGQVLGAAVRASSTVTFAGHKLGLHQYPGVAYAGIVETVAIGVPVLLEERAEPIEGGPHAGLIEESDVAALLPVDPGDAHKGTRGHVLAIAGSRGKTGAALLAGLGALRAGAGLVTIASDDETQRVLEQKVVELMTARFDESDALDSLLQLAKDKRAVLLGPGFGLTPERQKLARELAVELELPCVIDADALTALAGALELLRQARGPRILTPHPGEAARLLDRSILEVQADRCAAARELAARSGQVVVLKGACTVIASPQGALRICRAGTPALGVAGTGDVLSGVVAALSVRALPFSAAWAGVQIHALAGQIAAQGDRGLLASEVAAHVPVALARMRQPSLSEVAGRPTAVVVTDA